MEKTSYSMATSILKKRGTVMNFSFPKREFAFLAALLIGAFLVRVLSYPLQGYQNDTATFSYWMNTAAEVGVRPFYTVVLRDVGWIDYPPFNVYIFWVFGSLAKAAAAWGINIVNIMKLAPTLFDLATSALIYVFVRKQLSTKHALLTTALYAFNPAIIFNVAVWGQFDAIYTFFLVLSLIFALKNKPQFSAAVFALALLTKPQGIALLPLIIYLIYRKSGWKNLLTSTAVFFGSIFLVILPFEWTNPVTFLSRIYFGAYDWYKFTSINAFNVWGMFGMWRSDQSFYIIGWAMFGVVTAFTLYVLHKRFAVSGDLLAVFCAFMILFAFFMLPTRIHERYLFPAISMLVLLIPFAKKIRLHYIGLTTTLLVNQAYVLSFLNSPNPFIPDGDLVVLLTSIINLVMFFYALVLMLDELKGRGLKTQSAPSGEPTQRGEPT